MERWAFSVVYLNTVEAGLIQSNLEGKILGMVLGLLRNELKVCIKTQSAKLLECELMGKARELRYVGGGCRYVFLTFFCNLGKLFLFCKIGVTIHPCFSKVPLRVLMKCYIQRAQDKSLYLPRQLFLC